jgi:hypothetical protein
MLKIGGVEAMKQDYRAEGGLPLIENLVRHVRFALRRKAARRDLRSLPASPEASCCHRAIPLIETVSSQLPQSSRDVQNREGVPYKLTWVAN